MSNVNPPNISIEFPLWVETISNGGLTFSAIISIPVHLLLICLALFRTPKEMNTYRFTVTNTSFWSLLFIIHETCFFRAIPLLPFPVGKVEGVLGKLGDYYGGYVQFVVLAILIFNVVSLEFKNYQKNS
jgi:hypothetical protein